MAPNPWDLSSLFWDTVPAFGPVHSISNSDPYQEVTHLNSSASFSQRDLSLLSVTIGRNSVWPLRTLESS